MEKRLIEEVQKNDILIIVGETGSGKTTRKLFSDLMIVLNFLYRVMKVFLFIYRVASVSIQWWIL